MLQPTTGFYVATKKMIFIWDKSQGIQLRKEKKARKAKQEAQSFM